MIYGELPLYLASSLTENENHSISFEPEAEQTCERLLEEALGVDPGNSEAYQTLASVRLSQQRPEDAKTCLENAWMAWKDLDLGSSSSSSIYIS